MNGKCTIDNMNDNMHLIGILLLSFILIVVIIYFYRNVMQKHCDIVEKFSEEQDYDATIDYENNYGIGHTSGSDSLDKKTIDGNITLRPCQIYFVGEEHQEACDNAESTSACKYNFAQNMDDLNDVNNWMEIDSIETNGQVNTYPKKIYNQNYTKTDITNHDEMTQCFKRFNNENDIKYMYKQNNLIRYDYGGQSTGDTIELRYRTDSSDDYKIGNFISMKFGNANTPMENNNSAIDSICSLKRNKISSLNSITTNSYNPFFYRFALDSNNQLKSIVVNEKTVLDIKLVELNHNQTGFIDHGIANFPNKNLIGIDYSEIIGDKIHFNVYKNMQQPPISCKIYKFKYNYLCDNGILNYLYPYETKMHITSFIDTHGYDNIDAKKTWNIINKVNLTHSDMLKYNRKNPRADQKEILVADLREKLSHQLENSTQFTNLDAQIAELNTNKSKWDTAKTTATSNKDSFHNTTFENIMYLRKPDFINPVTNVTTYNTHIKPFKYRKGYQAFIEDPDAPYDPAKKYGTIDILNNNLLEYELASNIKYDGKGLDGRRHDQRYRSWWWWNTYYNDGNLNHFRGVRSHNYQSGKTNFHNLRAHRGEKYGYYWKGHFVAQVEGHYHFATWSDDGSHVWLDGRKVVDNGGLHGRRRRGGYAGYFQKGDIKKVEITFAENYGGDNLTFGWHSPQIGPGWYHSSDKQIKDGTVKRFFYQKVQGQDGSSIRRTPKWSFIDGAYYTTIESDGTGRDIIFDAIYINNKKVNGVQQIPDNTIANPDRWHRLVYEDNTVDDGTDYIFYFKETTPEQRAKRIFLKAEDKPKTLEQKVLSVMSDAVSGEADVSWVTISDDTIWSSDNGVTSSASSISLKPYKLHKISFKGFIFLQRGKYKFNINLGLPSNLTIQEAQLIFDTDLTINPNIEYIFDYYHSQDVIDADEERKNMERLKEEVEGDSNTAGGATQEEIDALNAKPRRSKFYKYDAQYYVLNDTGSPVDVTFNFNVDYKSLDDSIIHTNISINNLSYCGSDIYTDNGIVNFWNKFSRLKTFEPNTIEDFAELKSYLMSASGRGNDFWNLVLINHNIDTINATISSQSELLEEEKKKLTDKYNYIIDGIDKLDYEKTFLKNKAYFDNPEIVFKENVNISSIFRDTAATLDGNNEINNYITYEKISNVSLRTPPTKNDINFNPLDNSKKFIYVLKDSIDIKDAVKASF